MPLDAVKAAVRGVGLVPDFQPIVSLPDASVVGFEALARWPSLDVPGPHAVFAHARASGRIDQLDQMCIDTAIDHALRSSIGRNALLCLNCEPMSTGVRRADNAFLERGHNSFQLMFELTERHLLERPHALMQKVSDLRADGFAIALDDVGAHPASLALLDVICPDVIKLDLALVQSQPDHDQARTVTAVLAHHERTGAAILAEGIETAEHLEQALALGATLGQGYKFGRPGRPEEHPCLIPWSPPRQRQLLGWRSRSPFDLVQDRAPVRTARKETLVALSRHLERQALRAADPPVLLTALQSADYFSGYTQRTYRDFAASSPLVAIFGDDLPGELGDGIRGVALDPGDPLSTEWTVLTLGPHTAAALIAREKQGENARECSEGDRRFDFLITYDRPLVAAAARNLLDRVR